MPGVDGVVGNGREWLPTGGWAGCLSPDRVAILILVALLPLGCAPGGRTSEPGRAPASRPADVAPITNTDACAGRLHELCGPLLLYYAQHQGLPEKLDELTQVPGFEVSGDLVCPVSNRAYVYNRAGLPGREPNSRVVICDPLPSHSGIRWGISITEPGPGEPLIAKVIGVSP